MLVFVTVLIWIFISAKFLLCKIEEILFQHWRAIFNVEHLFQWMWDKNKPFCLIMLNHHVQSICNHYTYCSFMQKFSFNNQFTSNQTFSLLCWRGFCIESWAQRHLIANITSFIKAKIQTAACFIVSYIGGIFYVFRWLSCYIRIMQWQKSGIFW